MIGAKTIGAVVIGRNEGQRLLRCLASLPPEIDHVVYVDSSSTDGSVEAARAEGAEILSLDMATPFTAARARNAGFSKLMKCQPFEFVQFIDGDCELCDGWLEAAIAFLSTEPEAAVASGQLRERNPDASVYNRLCDQEWDTPIGEARYCGGIAMMRAEAFRQIGGFNSTLIAGEEPELCVRLRAKGWKIWRLDCEMAWHDAAIMQFSQWWKRTKRGGYAFAEGAAMHGAPPERHWVRPTQSILVWGGGDPHLCFGERAVLVCLGFVRPHHLSASDYSHRVPGGRNKISLGSRIFYGFGEISPSHRSSSILEQTFAGKQIHHNRIQVTSPP